MAQAGNVAVPAAARDHFLDARHVVTASVSPSAQGMGVLAGNDLGRVIRDNKALPGSGKLFKSSAKVLSMKRRISEESLLGLSPTSPAVCNREEVARLPGKEATTVGGADTATIRVGSLPADMRGIEEVDFSFISSRGKLAHRHENHDGGDTESSDGRPSR